MKDIQGKERNLQDLLANKKYTIPFYQREYRWERKQVEELINDLMDEFDDSFNPEHLKLKDRSCISEYASYYMGSVILNTQDNAIIDGQQRLTTLTLLLIYLDNLQKEKFSEDEQSEIKSLICSKSYGSYSFNMNVEERAKCLESLYRTGEYTDELTDPSIKNICDRYADIVEIFQAALTENEPSEEPINDKKILFFIDWLINKVFFIEIKTENEQDAYKVFVTMNDRGLRLTPSDMLKGYLLSQITDNAKRTSANKIWKDQLTKLNKAGTAFEEKDFIDDFIRDWLRAQYADSIKENKKGALPQDFDLIGTGFHKWVKDNALKLGLRSSDDYYLFITGNFKEFSNLYIKLNEHAHRYSNDFEYIYYNANRSITSLQYLLEMAAIDINDTEDMKNRKLKLVSCYMDQYIVRRVINFKSVGYSAIKYAIFTLTRQIRRNSIDEIKAILKNTVQSLKDKDDKILTLEGIKDFYLNNFFKWHVQHILARLTDFVERGSEVPETSFEKYVDTNRKNRYDIEHITPNDYLANKDKYVDEREFESQRNMLGDLILLPADKNRSYQDMPFSEKVEKYFGENLLAKTLNHKCYENNPRFLKFKSDNNFDFKGYDDFDKSTIRERQELYYNLAKMIWNPDNLDRF